MKKTTLAMAVLAAGFAVEAAAEWIPCAKENEICRFQGKREVQYGVGTHWFTKVHTNGVKCDVAHFGGDPAQGQFKTCRVSDRVIHESQPGQPAVTRDWARCAGESEVCAFKGERRVAYGAEGRYRQRVAKNGIKCTNEAFGGDPIQGKVKACYLAP